MNENEKREVVVIPAEPLRGASDGAVAERPRAAGSVRRFSKGRLIVAFSIACVSDIVEAAFTWAPPIVWAVDLVTAGLLFVVLGWSWFLLPGLVLEAIPGLEVLPFWVLVVGAIALFGDPRPRW